MRQLLPLAVACLSWCAPPAARGDDKKATEVDGTWKLTGYIENGAPDDRIVKQNYVVTRAKGVQTITKGGQPFSTHTFEVDPAKDPKRIDIIDEKGGRLLGVYELKGNEMRLAVRAGAGPQKGARPDSLKEAGNLIAVYTREPIGERAAAVRFLKEHVNGRALAEPESTFRVAGGKVESVASSTVRFRNFTETKSGFYFDAETTIRQTLYELGADGKRVEPGQKKDRRFVWRYQVGERRSTTELVGIAFRVTESGGVADDGDYPFTPYAVTIRAGGGTLTVAQSGVLYQDLFAKGGGWRPGIEEMVAVYAVKDGKLQRTVKLRGYDVDPRTLEKKLSDDLPERVEKQVDDAPPK